jgi:lysophospholipase L1-like esterase
MQGGQGYADGGTTREEVLNAYANTPGAVANPDEDAINYWMGAGLGNFQDVVNQVNAAAPAAAPAASTIAAAPAASTTTTPAQISSDISQMYRDVLGREADTEGLNYWAQQFGGHGQLTPEDRATWMSIAKPGTTYNPNQITALGDSTTWGYNSGSRVGTNMTDAAQQDLSQMLGRDIQINNMGVNSSSLGDAIGRGDITKALQDASPTVLLNYGMNEAYRQEDPNAFRNNLETTVQQFRNAGKDVVLQTPNYTEGIPGVNQYADVIRDVASKYGLGLQDKWKLTSNMYDQYNKNDLVHPTEEIYRTLGKDLAGVLGSKYGQPRKAAAGGIASLASGGRFLKGPGDGVSDSIPARFADSGRPARLADGEFVIDARTVSEIGNGSSEAGARKLYEMMDRVHKARRKAKRGEASGADKYLPK